MRLRIVRAGEPGAASAVQIAVAGIRAAVWSVRAGNRVRAPFFVAGSGVDEPANSKLPAALADQHHAVDDERRERHGVALARLRVDGLVPDHVAVARIEGDNVIVQRRQIGARAVQGDAAIHHVAADGSQLPFGEAAIVFPKLAPVGRVECVHSIERRRDDHRAPIHDRRRFKALGDADVVREHYA